MAVHRTTRSNVVILTVFLGLACVLIASAPFVSDRKPILSPESPEIAAKRLSSENAYAILSEAAKLWPGTLPPLAVPANENSKRIVAYQPKLGSLAWLMRINRPDEDPEFIAYMKSCEPAVEKAREALKSPYFLYPIEWNAKTAYAKIRDTPQDPYWNMISVAGAMMAKSLFRMRAGDEQAAVALFLDTFCLCLMLGSDGDWEPRVAIQKAATMLLYIDETARKLSEEALRHAQNELLEIRRRLKPPIRNVEFLLRTIDAKTWFNSKPLYTRPRQRILRRMEDEIMLRKLRSLAKRHLAELRAVVERPYPEVRKLCSALREEDRDKLFSAGDELGDAVNRIAASYPAAQVLLDGAVLVFALELHRRAEASFPEKLEALAPKYIDSLPNDAFTESAFAYSRSGDDYKLYSFGDDMADDGGGTQAWEGIQSRGDDIVIHWPLNEDAP